MKITKYLKPLLVLNLLFLTFTTDAQYSGAVGSREMKKTVLKSFLFRNAEMFYPDGMPNDLNKLPDLEKKQKKEILRDLNRLYKYLIKRNLEIANFMEEKFGIINTHEHFKKIILHQKNKGILETKLANNNKYLVIDLKVLQAIFRASIIESTIDENMNLTDFEKMKSFFDFQDDVNNTRSFGMIRDLLGGTDSPWFSMIDYIEKTDGIEKRYLSTLLFAISHELGHLALNHLEHQKHDNCKLNHKMEYEADEYAIWMMIYIFQNQLFYDSFLGGSGFFDYSFRTLLGDEVFFNKAIYLAEFNSDDCSHPDIKDRKQKILHIYESLDIQYEIFE